eukprot:s72_g25.t1
MNPNPCCQNHAGGGCFTGFTSLKPGATAADASIHTAYQGRTREFLLRSLGSIHDFWMNSQCEFPPWQNAETFAREHKEAIAGFLQDLNALKTLLPYAAAETTYWSKPLNLALFESLEAHLRNIASHSAALDQVRVSSLPAWPALYRFFHQQLLHNVIEIRDITEGLLSSHSEDSSGPNSESTCADPERKLDNLELQEVRQRLAESLYTFQVAEKMATTLTTMVAKKLGRSSTRT